MTNQEANGKWWVYYRDASSNWDIHVVSKTNCILQPSTSSPNYTYGIDSGLVDIKLSLSNTPGNVNGYISGPGFTGSYNLSGDTFSASDSCSFLQAMSMPEVLSGESTANLRCGSYLENVKFSNCKLYSAINYGGTVYNFYPDSSVMNTAFVYCDDVATYSRTATNEETIEIDYSIGYQS